jgi:translocator protein
MDILSLFGFVGFFVVCFAAALTGAKYRPDDWYRSIKKPWWNPPDWIFAPAWAVFYSLMVVSGWLVWREAGLSAAALPLAAYGLHLVFNAAWSPLFFGLRRIGLALIDAGLMWLTLAVTIATFASINHYAAMLLIPYLGWVSFAFVLNAKIFLLNRNPGRPARSPDLAS